MYLSFKQNGQSLPGEEDILKDTKQVFYIMLFPFKCDIPSSVLPPLPTPQVNISPEMSIDALKKYLFTKLRDRVQSEDEIVILYKNQEMPNHYTVSSIGRTYGFPDDKIVFNYMKCKQKQNKQSEVINID
jgi:hypothetical protein